MAQGIVSGYGGILVAWTDSPRLSYCEVWCTLSQPLACQNDTHPSCSGHPTVAKGQIPIVDVFAGPGGLGEGLSRFRDALERPRFRLVLSIEKDRLAHKTLRLRAFYRQFGPEALPDEYHEYTRGRITWEGLASAYPTEASRAEREAFCLTLAPDAETIAQIRELIASRIGQSRFWGLVGGPPCQAYSLVGRSRNRGNKAYVAESDHRQTLYVEYLQILADHNPAFFVMENVKGMLSAKLHSQQLFRRIVADLRDPSRALTREGRSTKGRPLGYSLHSLVVPGEAGELDPSDFVVRAEHFGVPQRRHRVIIVGVREDLARSLGQLVPVKKPLGVWRTVKDLPPLRSGLSDCTDSREAWIEVLRSFKGEPWLKALPSDVGREAKLAIEKAGDHSLDRGSEVAARRNRQPIFNHSTRGHMKDDLKRYLFASAFASVRLQSPTLVDFPEAILPNHANVPRALETGHFADRFRVQLAEEPATTVTSHISKDGHYFIHPSPWQCRSLTVREAAALQAFPDDYFFCGPRTAQYVQVGNAVPPLLAEQIARVLADAF